MGVAVQGSKTIGKKRTYKTKILGIQKKFGWWRERGGKIEKKNH